MRSFSELAGRDLQWRGDLGMGIIPDAERHYVLWDGAEPVVTAQVMWKRQVFFDVIMECGEGTYQAHLDLTRVNRPSVAWKTGEDHSLVGLEVTNENIIACSASIVTHSNRQLWFEPTMFIGYEYTVFPPGGQRLLTLAAWAAKSIGGNPGHMSIASEAATDVEMPALVVIAFALANEQVMLLHRPEGVG